MTIRLDHTILPVNDLDASLSFYTGIMGFEDEGFSEPFHILRVAPDLLLQLAGWGTGGGTHLAFAMDRGDFDRVFGRVREAGVPYGDSFGAVGNSQGPGEESGARGVASTLYFFDPNQHLLEIRCYPDRAARREPE